MGTYRRIGIHYMKALYFFIFSFCVLSCVPSEKEKAEAQKIREQDSIAAVQANLAAIEARKPPILKEFEQVEKEGRKVVLYDFIRKECIAARIKDNYGDYFYNYIVDYLQKDNSPVSIMGDNELGNNNRWFISATLDAGIYYQLMLSYNLSNDILKVSMSINGNHVNTDGTFNLFEGSQWKGLYLDKDEFGDPDRTKPYVTVSSSSASSTDTFGAGILKIAVLKGYEENIILYNDGVLGVTSFLDKVEVLSITVKDKNTEEVFSLSDYELANSFNIILSEEDSQKIKDLCNKPGCDFSIKLKIRNYSSDWMDFGADDYETNIQNFENGVAYGLDNATMAYFYKAF